MASEPVGVAEQQLLFLWDVPIHIWELLKLTADNKIQPKFPLGHLQGGRLQKWLAKKRFPSCCKETRRVGRGHQQLGTGCITFIGEKDPFPAKRDHLYLKDHSWLLREGKDLIYHLCSNRYKWEKVKDVLQNTHTPMKYINAWQVKISGKWCLFNVPKVLLKRKLN